MSQRRLSVLLWPVATSVTTARIFREPLDHTVNCAVLGLDVSHDRHWNQRAYICRRQQHSDRFEIAGYSNGMDSERLSMTQTSLEVLGKKICFFMCRDALRFFHVS